MQAPEVPSPEELLGLGQPRFSALEVSARSGFGVEDAKRLWRAMGFVVVPETDIYFTEADVTTLTELRRFMAAGFADLEAVLGTARTMSQSLARVTETEVQAIRQQLMRSPELAIRVLESRGGAAEDAFNSLELFLVHVWRRHLAHALHRAQVLEPQGRIVRMAVGFADLVGFTRLSHHLDDEDLGRLIERFESIAQDAATAVGGRIVKTIGDEVMFVADHPEQIADVALGIIEGCSASFGNLQIRGGATVGELISHHGDFFGSTVNLASRAARTARPDSCLVSEELARELSPARYITKRIPERQLKGLGTTQLYVLRRANPPLA